MTPAPIKPTIKYEDLDKIDIRVGTIEKVEDIVESDKLLRFIVDFGDHKRNIIVGMKQERENPQELEGMQTLFVVNLKPKKIMSYVSEGMIYDIGFSDKINPVLATTEKPVPNGVRVG